jgi:GDP-D-mannose 3',5'-epimerase
LKRALVCGAGGFIGGHLVKKLKREGYWVRGVDIKEHEFAPPSGPPNPPKLGGRGGRGPEGQADEFLLLDLREPQNCRAALTLPAPPSPQPWGGSTFDDASPNKTPFDDASSNTTTFDEVYQLAADMGGMGFISVAECEVLHNNALININMTHAAAEMGVPRYFFSSSVCVYRDMQPGEPELTEDDAIPANPDNEYGWEKLYAERVAMAYGRRPPCPPNFGGLGAVRIARFQNCYGPEGTWCGGREKAPAAICRKVAMAENGGTIPVWGDGTAIRAYTYVDDLVEGVYMLMHSDLEGPTIIGSDEYVTVDELVQTVISVSGKEIQVKYVEGPVGVQARNFSKARIRSLGWEAKVSLKEGISRTYSWIRAQVNVIKLSAAGRVAAWVE